MTGVQTCALPIYIEDRILECCVAHADRLPGADHLPVHTVLETSPRWSAPVERCSFEKVDWPAFVRMLTQHLQDTGVSADVHIEMAEELDNFVGLCYDSFHAQSQPRPCVRSTPDRSPTFHRERAPRRVASRDPLLSRAPARRANASWYARPLEVRAGSLLPAL